MLDIGLGGLVILALDIWAILQIVGSKEEDLKGTSKNSVFAGV